MWSLLITFQSIMLFFSSLVLICRNPVHSVLSLVLVFVCGSITLFFLSFDFLALLFVIVYVGAIAVLFLFVVMMLNLHAISFVQSLFNYYMVAFSFLISIYFFFVVTFPFEQFGKEIFLKEISQFWIYSIYSYNNINLIGELLYTYYFFPFILSSLILLVSMVCSICLTMLSKSFLFRKQDIYIQIIRSNNLDLFLFLFYLEMVNSFYQLSFQSAVTPLMESIVSLHNHIFFFLLLVFVFVFWIFGNIIYYFYYLPTIDLEYRCSTVFLRYFNHNAYLEIIWTIIPSLILIVIAIPSFALLYSMDEPLQPTLTLKVVGHQWYWSYEYSNWLEENIPLVFDSYMLNEDELNFGEYRLLQVDNPVVLPVETQLRFIITAEDVIHSFAVPQLGVKLDAIPGRLNQQGVYLYRSGVFYGQCSELCGVNHGFMPIVIKGVTFPEFFDWYIVHL